MYLNNCVKRLQHKCTVISAWYAMYENTHTHTLTKKHLSVCLRICSCTKLIIILNHNAKVYYTQKGKWFKKKKRYDLMTMMSGWSCHFFLKFLIFKNSKLILLLTTIFNFLYYFFPCKVATIELIINNTWHVKMICKVSLRNVLLWIWWTFLLEEIEQLVPAELILIFIPKKFLFYDSSIMHIENQSLGEQDWPKKCQTNTLVSYNDGLSYFISRQMSHWDPVN